MSEKINNKSGPSNNNKNQKGPIFGFKRLMMMKNIEQEKETKRNIKKRNIDAEEI